VSCVVSAAGRHAPPEVECFALQLGISAALAKGCQRLVVISDSLPAVESLFNVELQSGQVFSLDCCCTVGPWLAGDLECSVHLWFMPSRMEWGTQKAAHDIVMSLKIAVGRRPWTSHNFLCQHADIEALKDWCELFKDPSYRGHSFLDLFFFFFNSTIYNAVLDCSPWEDIQTMRKLRLRYAVPVYVLPKALVPSLAGKRGQAHEFPWMMSPLRAGCAVEPSQLGQHQTTMHHRIVLIVFPSRNPTQGWGSCQMVLLHCKPPPPEEGG
jgi:hypothetical protein